MGVDPRDNWRVILLVVVVLGSTFALFSPTMAGASSAGPGTATDGPTNLKYGLQLSGGTRIRAPLVGVTAEGVDFAGDDPATVERRVAAELGNVSASEVTARLGAGNESTVEATVDGVTRSELASALDAAGYEYDAVRDGVTQATRQQTVEVLQNKINEAGLSGGTVQVITTSTGDEFILVEVPNQNRQEVVDLVTSRGTVTVQAYYPVERNGSQVYERETILTRETFQSIGTAQQGEGGQQPFVPVTVRDEAAERVRDDMVRTGIAQEGGSRCTYETNPNSTEPCLLVVVDGEVVNSFGMAPSLARSMRSGEWVQDPSFVLQTRNFSEAREVAINLRAGALPAPLDLGADGEGTSSFVSPSQGERFKTNSLITGIVAVLAVSAVVFLRYGDPKVALPMIVTALSEVIILLGFAAGIGYPLDLSVIAGFIAVIGTGVDDLIIIADEVMAEGDVNSRRVFKSRFRKAFWVIGVAAATTIIAMSPLAVLSLGDLQGFAIFTILGVIAGVLLTRPAYGDILRSFLTER
ncbi:MAG: preprotein translocase subunit SecD [Haloferacaceae archaeon]